MWLPGSDSTAVIDTLGLQGRRKVTVRPGAEPESSWSAVDTQVKGLRKPAPERGLVRESAVCFTLALTRTTICKRDAALPTPGQGVENKHGHLQTQVRLSLDRPTATGYAGDLVLLLTYSTDWPRIAPCPNSADACC
jgi:hypothetical protein